MNFIRPGEAGHELKSIRDPGPPTLRDAIDAIDENIFEAARRAQTARSAFQRLPPGDPKEAAMKGWETQANAEKEHWTRYKAAYRTWLDLHPELADKPLGSRCVHGADCTIDAPRAREPGADDEVPMTWDDRRLPPERDPDGQSRLEV